MGADFLFGCFEEFHQLGAEQGAQGWMLVSVEVRNRDGPPGEYM
jgi:hypothetical protein